MNEGDLNARKRRILFRAKHRGMKEMDLLLGRLADEVLGELDEAGVAAFERLLEVPDAVLLDWIAGAGAPPPEYDTALLERLRRYRFDTGSYGENL
jgi:antitoxin CptB